MVGKRERDWQGRKKLLCIRQKRLAGPVAGGFYLNVLRHVGEKFVCV